MPPSTTPHGAPRGATWVTREHVFVDRVACPWLIRRHIDPDARFEFVPWDADVAAIERAGKIPFDFAEGGYTHEERDGREICTFEVLLRAFGLEHDEALRRVARVVHAADVERDLDTSPEARGLRAISLGWRYEHLDDHEAVREGEKIYDALYTWAKARIVQERDARAMKGMTSLERYHHLRRELAAK